MVFILSRNSNTVFYDSHCHLDRLDLSPFENDFSRFMAQAQQAGISGMLCVSINLDDWPAMCEQVADYPQVKVSVGVHPNEEADTPLSVTELIARSEAPNVVAIGETGLDYFRSGAAEDWQHARFVTHIEAAKAVNKPVIIHSREAREDTLAVLEREGADACGGVMHCFVEDWHTARRALDLGFYISFSGVLTYKSAAELREVARKLPQDRILIETDSPYLAPVPHRGKPNYPQYVRHIAEVLAEVRGENLHSVADYTAENYHRLFRIS